MKLLSWTCRISGGLLVLASIPHATAGLSAQFDAISKGYVTGEARDDLILIWVFSSMTMFLMGAWLLFLSTQIKKENNASNWIQALLVSLGLLGFGLWGGFYSANGQGMFGFAVMGLLVLIPLLIYRPEKA
ncbi:MAG TPA: hypothetical protein PLL64_02160 [Rhodothermales bacterium]|nr:hypothetical protein [Bacteroidota bacterium]HRK73050.1 hypothetical protein [Rhodothermales bacterium]HRR09393.1 hypothetical protein [Rhodothermales bacterium]